MDLHLSFTRLLLSCPILSGRRTGNSFSVKLKRIDFPVVRSGSPGINRKKSDDRTNRNINSRRRSKVIISGCFDLSCKESLLLYQLCDPSPSGSHFYRKSAFFGNSCSLFLVIDSPGIRIRPVFNVLHRIVPVIQKVE